jgi:hypothetical protein
MFLENSIAWEKSHNMYMYIDQNLSQWGFEPQSLECIKSGVISIYITRTAQFLVNSKNCMYIARHEEAIIYNTHCHLIFLISEARIV